MTVVIAGTDGAAASAVDVMMSAVTAGEVEVIGSGCVVDADITASPTTTAGLVAVVAVCSTPQTVCPSVQGLATLGTELNTGGANSADVVFVNEGCPNMKPPDVVKCVVVDTDNLSNSASPDCEDTVVDVAGVVDSGLGRTPGENIRSSVDFRPCCDASTVGGAAAEPPSAAKCVLSTTSQSQLSKSTAHHSICTCTSTIL